VDDDAPMEPRPAGLGSWRKRRVAISGVTAVLVALVPFGALPVLALGRWFWGGNWRLTRGWWLALAPLAVWALAHRAITGSGGGLAVAVLLIAFAAWAVNAPWRSLLVGGFVALLLLTTALAIERQAGMHTFHDVRVDPGLDFGRVAALAAGFQRLEPDAAILSRFWHSDGPASELTVSLDLRLLPRDAEAPTVPTIELAIAPSRTTRAAWVEVAVEPGDAWQRLEVVLTEPRLEAGGRVWTGLRVRGGATVDVRRVSVAASDGPPLAPRPHPPRQRLWFGGPNLLGHVLTATGLMTLAVSPHPAIGAATIAATLVGQFFTGSRTATVAFVAFAPLLWLAILPRRRRKVAAIGLALAVVVVTVSFEGDGLGRLGRWSLEDRNVLSRSVEMSDAWAAMVAHPWVGVGEGGLRAPAHNAWLQLGGEHGVLALLAGIWLGGFAVALAWRFAGWRGVWLALGVLTMQFTDDSWRYPGVFLPLLLGVAARSSAGATRGDRDADRSDATSPGREGLVE